MDPREELMALRRMAELEAKASGQAAPSEMLAPLPSSDAPTGRRIIEGIRPTVEALAGAGGAVLGTPLGPMGMVGGAGLGYGLAKGGLDVVEQALGYRKPPESVGQALVGGTKDVLEGATTEAFGRGVVAPVIAKGAEYASKLKNIKLDQYLKAVGDKGEDIVNALRGRVQIVPGTAPTAGEAAAGQGSVGLSVLQSRARQVPGAADAYASQEAQNIAARQAQEARATEKFNASVQRIQGKIDRGLVNVTPGEVGGTLIDAAKAEQRAVKSNVIRPAYDAAFDAAGNAKIDVSKVVSEAERILERKLSSFAATTTSNGAW